MTANRWWVKLAARWLARVDGVKGQVQMFSLAVTAFSTFSIMLQGFGLGFVVPYLGVVSVIVGIIYTYYFTEGGVWNQVARDRSDLSSNFASPSSRINSEIMVRGIGAVDKGRPLNEDERNAIQSEIADAFAEYRDGVDIQSEIKQ